MSRRIAWVMFVAGVMFFGGLISSQQNFNAGPADARAAQADDQQDPQAQPNEESQDQPNEATQNGHTNQESEELSETVVQLKKINVQLKELKDLLCSGKVKVYVVMNPPQE